MPRKKQQAVDAFIGARVRMRRLMLEMSQEDLSNRIGVTFQQIQKYEKGINRISASRLLELSVALDVPVQFFFDGLERSRAAVPDGMAEDPAPFNPYLDFVSSGPGVELNRGFLKINDEGLKQQVLSMVANLARISRR